MQYNTGKSNFILVFIILKNILPEMMNQVRKKMKIENSLFSVIKRRYHEVVKNKLDF